MKRFLRRFVARLALVAALVPCVPAFGEAVETVAYWNRDFGTTTKGGYTVTLGEGATLNPDGTVTLAEQTGQGKLPTHGVEISFYDESGATAFVGTELTVLVKYSGLLITNSRYPLLSTIWGDNKDAAEFVLSVKNQNKMYYADGITAATTSVSDKEMGSVTQTLPTEGYMLVSMSGYQDGNAGCKGTRIGFAPLNEDGSCGDFIDYGYQSAATHTDKGFYGIKVGGTIGPIMHFYRPGMKVEQVAIIKGFTTTMRTFRYLFPNEAYRFDYAGQNPTAETKYIDGVMLKSITDGIFAAKVYNYSVNWAGGMVCACQKALAPAEGDAAKMAIQYQVRNSDYDKSADIYYTNRTDGVYFRKTGGHYNAVGDDKLGTDDATWSNQNGNYSFYDFSVYAPFTTTASVSGSRNWSQISWTEVSTPTAADIALINATGNSTITFNATSAVGALRIASTTAKVTLRVTDVTKIPATKNWDFSQAAGKIAFNCSSLSLSGSVVLLSGTLLGTENIDIAGSSLPSGGKLIVTKNAVTLSVAQWTRGAGTDDITDADNWKGGYVPYRDGAFTDDFSLAADADWSAVTISAMNGKAIDLNGHRLTLSSLGGTGTVTDSSTAAPGAFVASVASGKTLENTGVALSGNLKLVKEGAGTFVPSVPMQTYTGGTVVNAGVIKASSAENDGTSGNRLGANDTDITVNAGGTFDVNGKFKWSNHDFVLNGGILANYGALMNGYASSNGYGIHDIRLEADSFVEVAYGTTFGHDDAVIELNGHTLKVSHVGTKSKYACLYIRSTIQNGTFLFGSKVQMWPIYDNVFGENLTVESHGDFRRGSATLALMNLVDASENINAEPSKTAVFTVTNSFTPITRNFQNTKLGDGATLNLSAVTGTWSLTSAIADPQQTVTFADAAAIVVDFTGRKDLADGMKVVSWTDETKPPESVTFKGVGIFGSLVRKDDGLYVDRGVITIFR